MKDVESHQKSPALETYVTPTSTSMQNLHELESAPCSKQGLVGSLCKSKTFLQVGAGRLARRNPVTSELAVMRVAIKAIEASQVCTDTGTD